MKTENQSNATFGISMYGTFQPAFTYSKRTIKTLEQGVKYVQS